MTNLEEQWTTMKTGKQEFQFVKAARGAHHAAQEVQKLYEQADAKVVVLMKEVHKSGNTKFVQALSDIHRDLQDASTIW